MKRTLLSVAACAAFTGLTLVTQPLQVLTAAPRGVQGQPPPPAGQTQSGEIATRLSADTAGAPPKLAIAPFVALSPDAETTAAAKTISDVLYDDIAYEREFYMIAKDAIATIPRPTSVDDVPLDRWKELNADGLIVGSIRKGSSGVVVQVKLIQVRTGKMLLGKEYSGSIANPRQYAHTISDEVHLQQIGLRGVARSKIAFASDRDGERQGTRDVKEIYVMDYDGANPRRITLSKTSNIAPSWSPDGQSLAYSAWRASGQFGSYQDVIVSWIYKGVRQTPANGSPEKQSYLPAYSPDGTRIAFTLSVGGNQEIYVMNVDGSGMKRMTNHPEIDTSPTWSPNGSQIAWVSGRSGTPQVYVMNADGTGQRKLTNESWADRPTWSREPFNEIAYAGRSGPGFDIKIYSIATGQTMRVTDGIGSNESPAFSANGRHLAFVSTRNGKAQIFTIDRDGTHLRQLTREGSNGFPNWSQ
jgi:TolB protein